MADGGSVSESGVELEAKSKEDSSWHPCRVSLSSTGVGLIVEFESQGLENLLLEKEEAAVNLRIRSIPLQGDDCCNIEQGERVLAAYKLQSKNLFYDAEVEKILRIRHSKRVYCRCTFMIKWLHENLREGTSTVPSSSILKLATKSVNDHPLVAAFLNSQKPLSCSAASPLPTFHADADFEPFLHKFLDEQIKEIGNFADASNKKISEDILFKVQDDASPSNVSLEQKQIKRLTRSRSKMQQEIEAQDSIPAVLPIKEELSEYRSRLSPLAALASFRSKLPLRLEFSVCDKEEKGSMHASDIATQKRVVESLNVTKCLNSCIGNNVSVVDKLSSEMADSVPIVPEPTNILELPTAMTTAGKQSHVKAVSRNLTNGRKKETKTSEITNSAANLMFPSAEKKLSQPSQVTRLTRLANQRNTKNVNFNCEMNPGAVEMKLGSLSSNRRLTRSAVQKGVGNLAMDVRQESEENKSDNYRKSRLSEGSINIISGCNKPRMREPLSSHPEAKIYSPPVEGRNKKQKMSTDAKTTRTKGNGGSS